MKKIHNFNQSSLAGNMVIVTGYLHQIKINNELDINLALYRHGNYWKCLHYETGMIASSFGGSETRKKVLIDTVERFQKYYKMHGIEKTRELINKPKRINI